MVGNSSYQKRMARNLLVYIRSDLYGLHCVNRSSWTATTLATLTTYGISDVLLIWCIEPSYYKRLPKTRLSSVCIVGIQKKTIDTYSLLFQAAQGNWFLLFQTNIAIRISRKTIVILSKIFLLPQTAATGIFCINRFKNVRK